ncbi:MAG TPA: outer membrane protein assembly factor BamB [Gammaproteobacteria bacterium]|nr:outer membrane protein assembly factor BamB [Gammaproteobacteria bacterium]
MRRLLIVLAAALFLAACGAKDNTEPPAPLVKFTPKVKVSQVWSADAGSGEDGILLGLVPAVDGNSVFVGGRDGSVSAWNVQSGSRLWHTDTGLTVGGGPGVGDHVVVVGSTEGYVEALSADDGHEMWKHYVDSIVIAAPAVGDGVVVVRTGDGHLIGLSAADGHQLWTLSRDVPRLSLRGDATPVIDRGVVYAGFDNGTLLAVSLKDGKVLWEAPIGQPSGENELQQLIDLDGRPVVGLGFVYAVTYHGELAALSATGGQPFWSIPMSSYTGVSYGDEQLYVTDSDSVVHAVNAASGDPAWKQAAMRARSLTRPTPFHGTVAMGDFAGYVHFLSQKSGELVARVQAGSAGISAAPVVAGDTLLVLTDDGELVAYRFPAAQ